MSPLLQRQLSRHLHGRPIEDPQWLALLDTVSKTYEEQEEDKKFLSHILEVTSLELTQANERLLNDAETQVRSINRYFEQTLDDQPSIIFRCSKEDGSFRIRLARGALLARLSKTHDTLEGADITALVGNENKLDFFENAWRGIDQRFELAFETPSLFCEVLLHSFREHGAVREILGVITDITETKKATARLEASEIFAREILNGLNSAVVILDGEGRIMSNNQAWLEVALSFGFDTKETGVGENYLDGILNSQPPAPSALILATGIRDLISCSRNDFTMEYRRHTPGQQQWFVCRASRLSVEGPVRVVVSHTDITELKTLQEQQNRSQRMESLGTLAGGIAHDLNNALAPIIMGGELLRLEHPRQSALLDTIQISAKRAAEMVRQLLAFAKGAAGAKIPLNVKHLVLELRNIIKSTFPKNIDLLIKLDENVPVILGDVTQLHQVLLNLCVNARDAMPQGGRLTLEVASVHVDDVYAAYQSDAKPGQYVKLTVNDTGTGIEPHDLNHIFEPFFTTKGPTKGTGLGLSTVLGIVKGHRGFIKVYSQLGKGSVFTVHLPVEKVVNNMMSIPKTAIEHRGHGETVLLVDDEAPIRQTGCAVLTKLGFKPLVASDGMEGLLLATEHRDYLSAVILDLDMPHMNGITLAQTLRRLRTELPVAAMSGRFSEATQASLLEVGVKVQLAKPFTEAQLAEAMNELLVSKIK